MLKLEEKTRNEIVQTLQMQVVPAGSGAILMQIAQILSGLKSTEEKLPDPMMQKDPEHLKKFKTPEEAPAAPKKNA